MSENRVNYDLICRKIINTNADNNVRPSLLLHACCAPCSSAVLEYIEDYFSVTVFFYNPNITSKDEYLLRLDEIKRFLKIRKGRETSLIVPDYDENEFFSLVSGFETCPERGSRCTLCYEMRLRKTAEYAAENGFEFFSTTLSVSPYKDAERLNRLGGELSSEYSVPYLFSDFKKNNGYKRSIELSAEYGLYRQNYCGCVFSKTT